MSGDNIVTFPSSPDRAPPRRRRKRVSFDNWLLAKSAAGKGHDPILILEAERRAAWKLWSPAQEAAERIEWSLPDEIRRPGVLMGYWGERKDGGVFYQLKDVEIATAHGAKPLYAHDLAEFHKLTAIWDVAVDPAARVIQLKKREVTFLAELRAAEAARDRALDERGYPAAAALEEQLEAAADAIELRMAAAIHQHDREDQPRGIGGFRLTLGSKAEDVPDVALPGYRIPRPERGAHQLAEPFAGRIGQSRRFAIGAVGQAEFVVKGDAGGRLAFDKRQIGNQRATRAHPLFPIEAAQIPHGLIDRPLRHQPPERRRRVRFAGVDHRLFLFAELGRLAIGLAALPADRH